MLVWYPNSAAGYQFKTCYLLNQGKYFGTRDVIFDVLALVNIQGPIRYLLAWVKSISSLAKVT
jgi:hypothetical protein